MSSNNINNTGGGGSSVFEERFLQMASEPNVDCAWLSEDKQPHVPLNGNRQLTNENPAEIDAQIATYTLIVQKTQRDFGREAKNKLITEYQMTDDGKKVGFSRRSFFPQQMYGDVKGVQVSPSGNFKCILRERFQVDTKKTHTEFEFWNNAALIVSVDVTDKHGKVMFNNDQFGHFTWSPCESFVSYAAQSNPPHQINSSDDITVRSSICIYFCVFALICLASK